MMLSHHAMHQPIKGLESDSIPACNAIKMLPIKEPANAQKDEALEGRDFSHSLAKQQQSQGLDTPPRSQASRQQGKRLHQG